MAIVAIHIGDLTYFVLIKTSGHYLKLIITLNHTKSKATDASGIVAIRAKFGTFGGPAWFGPGFWYVIPPDGLQGCQAGSIALSHTWSFCLPTETGLLPFFIPAKQTIAQSWRTPTIAFHGVKAHMTSLMINEQMSSILKDSHMSVAFPGL